VGDVDLTGGQATRPSTEKAGASFAFDIGCLTSEQQTLWEEHFGGLRQWTCGSTWQVTSMELWSFGQICMLEAGSLPVYPPELQAEVGDLARKLGEYRQNVRTSRKANIAT
jgi:hypothetical protein